MHSGYAELVKTALVSDAYWHMSSGELPRESFSGTHQQTMAEAFSSVRDYHKVARDKEVAYRIGSIVTSANETSTSVDIPWGEPIPELHSRQVVVAVEDSREVESIFKPERLITNAMSAWYMGKVKKKLKKQLAISGQEIHELEPDFEEQLNRFYEVGIPGHNSASTTVKYSAMQVAKIRRRALFLVRDEQRGVPLAVHPLIAVVPELRERPFIDIIPDTKVGSVYPKELGGELQHLGKIIAARVIDVHDVRWETPKRGNHHKKTGEEKKPAEEALPFAFRPS